MPQTHLGVAVIDVFGSELCTYFQPFTFHLFYHEFKHRIAQYGSNKPKSDDTTSDKVKECIRFMKLNDRTNYAQAIVSIYCHNDHQYNIQYGTPNELFKRRFFFNCDLKHCSISFEDDLTAIELIDKDKKEQQRVLSCVRCFSNPFTELSISEDGYADRRRKRSKSTYFPLIPFYHIFLKKQKDQEWMNRQLQIGCKFGRLHIVKLLLENGVDSNMKTETGNTPLSLACGNGNFNVVKILVENGAKVNDKMCLMEACGLSNDFGAGIVKYLVSKGCDVNQVDDNGKSALNDCIVCGNKKCFNILMDAGFDCNSLSCLDKATLVTPLQLACRYFVYDLYFCKRLVEAMDDINVLDLTGRSVLEFVTDKRFSYKNRLRKFLIDNGAIISP